MVIGSMVVTIDDDVDLGEGDKYLVVADGDKPGLPRCPRVPRSLCRVPVAVCASHTVSR
jgi:hypothetical protein